MFAIQNPQLLHPTVPSGQLSAPRNTHQVAIPVENIPKDMTSEPGLDIIPVSVLRISLLLALLLVITVLLILLIHIVLLFLIIIIIFKIIIPIRPFPRLHIPRLHLRQPVEHPIIVLVRIIIYQKHHMPLRLVSNQLPVRPDLRQRRRPRPHSGFGSRGSKTNSRAWRTWDSSRKSMKQHASKKSVKSGPLAARAASG